MSSIGLRPATPMTRPFGCAGVAAPSQYFFRQCYVATDADEKVLKQVVEAVGDDNIVVSTDYPHSDGLFPARDPRSSCDRGRERQTKARSSGTTACGYTNRWRAV